MNLSNDQNGPLSTGGVDMGWKAATEALLLAHRYSQSVGTNSVVPDAISSPLKRVAATLEQSAMQRAKRRMYSAQQQLVPRVHKIYADICCGAIDPKSAHESIALLFAPVQFFSVPLGKDADLHRYGDVSCLYATQEQIENEGGPKECAVSRIAQIFDYTPRQIYGVLSKKLDGDTEAAEMAIPLNEFLCTFFYYIVGCTQETSEKCAEASMNILADSTDNDFRALLF